MKGIIVNQIEMIVYTIPLTLSIDYILIKLHCRLMDFKEIKKKNRTYKKLLKSFTDTASKIMISRILVNKSLNYLVK